MPLNTFIQSTLGWELKAETLDFFQEFKTRDEAGFFELFDLLNQYCREEGLFLKGHHIDAVVDILLKQQRLPEDIEHQLKNHLQLRDPDGQNIRCLIERLRTERLPWLTVQARDNFYSHHTMYHSSEIKIRTSRAAEHLGLFVTKNPEETHYLRDQFLRPIFRLAVECHDFIQGKPGSAALGSDSTAEMASAAQVKEWLFSSLELPEDIRLLIDLVVDNAIPLATTLLFNKNKDKPRHLFDIFLLVEEKTHARLKAMSDRPVSSKQSLLNEIQAMNIVISACDLFPSSIRVVVQRQREQKQTDSLSNLNDNFGQGTLLLGKFFAGGSFSRYFAEGPIEDDYEVFLMTNTPHVEMGAELKVLSHSGPVIAFSQFEQSELAKRIIAFIHQCQIKHANSPADFNDFFEDGFKDDRLVEAVGKVFFSTIQAEIEFINSLYFILDKGEEKLKSLGYLNEQGQSLYALSSLVNVVPRFLDATVSHTDATNLASLALFFDASTTDKKQLIKELLWNSARQAGTTYMEFPKLGSTCTEPSVFIDCQSPISHPSKAGVAGTTYSIFHQRNMIIQQLNAVSIDSRKHGAFDDIPVIDDEYDSHSEEGDSVQVDDDSNRLSASVSPPG